MIIKENPRNRYMYRMTLSIFFLSTKDYFNYLYDLYVVVKFRMTVCFQEDRKKLIELFFSPPQNLILKVVLSLYKILLVILGRSFLLIKKVFFLSKSLTF